MENFISVQWLRSTLSFWVAHLSTNQMIKMRLGFLFRKFQVVYEELPPSPQLSCLAPGTSEANWGTQRKGELLKIPCFVRARGGLWIQFFWPRSQHSFCCTSPGWLNAWPDYLGWKASVLHVKLYRGDSHGHDQDASTVVGLALRRRNLQFKTKDFIWTRIHSSHDDQCHLGTWSLDHLAKITCSRLEQAFPTRCISWNLGPRGQSCRNWDIDTRREPTINTICQSPEK